MLTTLIYDTTHRQAGRQPGYYTSQTKQDERERVAAGEERGMMKERGSRPRQQPGLVIA
jgi:hypothetical protein